MGIYEELQKKLKTAYGTADTYGIAASPEMEEEFALAKQRRVPFGSVGYATTQHRGRPRRVGENIDKFGDLTTYLPGGIGDNAPRPGKNRLPRISPDVPVSSILPPEVQAVQAAGIAIPNYGEAPEMSKIDTVTDRFETMYRDAVAANDKFNLENFKDGVSGDAGSKSLAMMNSPQHGALIGNMARAFELFSKGSFADNANLQKEQRQNYAASAQDSLASIPYKKAMGEAALSNAAVARAEAEELINWGKNRDKKKKTGGMSSEQDALLNDLIFR